MKNKKSIHVIFEYLFSEYGEHEVKRIVSRCSKDDPMIAKEYEEYHKYILSNARKELRKSFKELNNILDPANEKICTKCPNSKKSDILEKCGCCKDCWSMKGHFSHSNSSSIEFRKELGKLKDTYGWDHVYGFWTENGCVLPRDRRSMVCLQHLCTSLRKELGDKTETVKHLTDDIRKYRKVLKSALL